MNDKENKKEKKREISLLKQCVGFDVDIKRLLAELFGIEVLIKLSDLSHL